MQPDREADACTCRLCVGQSLGPRVSAPLRLAFPLPHDDCPEEIVEALLRIDEAYVEAVEPVVLPRMGR